MLRAYSWLFGQESDLLVLWELYMVSKIEFRAIQSYILPAVLSLALD